ncbi:hypothetical protein T8T21_05700 [Limimaricola variabilis]|uniref:hypothetical protein n=1 Tax=Limimaricola variabilis TaxID=1492771 RepID=UPI002AC8D785|nr:hypothetical protein [Limimaricola variabilis]WPY95617.1 hypothetical protein T8T21_05700 [Limimaricola variabilis]
MNHPSSAIAPAVACPPPPALPLEGVAGEIAEVIGRDQTIRLIRAMRDTTGRSWRVCFYVPKRLPIDHQLVEVLGWNDARRLVRHFGGEILQTSNLRYIERAWRQHSIRYLRAAQRMSATDIAKYIGLSVYRVREILREIDAAC